MLANINANINPVIICIINTIIIEFKTTHHHLTLFKF